MLCFLEKPTHFRKAKRSALTIKVAYRKDEPGTVFEKAGKVEDLAMGGAFIGTEEPPPVGSPLLLELRAPSAWDPLELRGQVKWIAQGNGAHPKGFGIEFSALGKTQAAALFDLIQAAGFSSAEG